MIKDKDIFLRELRKLYKKNGNELKYIHVMEIGEKGARHHHLIINKCEVKLLQEAWYKAYEGHNRVKVFPLDDSGQYKELASYFIKYSTKAKGTEGELQKKAYNSSKNLKKPKSKIKIILKRDIDKAEIKAPKGYYVDLETIEQGITSAEYYGYGYLKYTVVKLE